MHNSIYRASYEPVDQANGKTREILPDIAFNTYASKFQEPKLKEGASRQLPFLPLSLYSKK
jgi:hypothetical protein